MHQHLNKSLRADSKNGLQTGAVSEDLGFVTVGIASRLFVMVVVIMLKHSLFYACSVCLRKKALYSEINILEGSVDACFAHQSHEIVDCVLIKSTTSMIHKISHSLLSNLHYFIHPIHLHLSLFLHQFFFTCIKPESFNTETTK